MPDNVVIRGSLGRARSGRELRRVVAVEEGLAGFLRNDELLLGPPQARVVGSAEPDDDGYFALEFEPSPSPSDAADWSLSVRVDVFEGADLVWSSGPRAAEAVVELGEELLASGGARAGVLPAARTSCVVQGTVTACGQPRAGLTMVVTEKARISQDQPGEPCVVNHQVVREVGHDVTDGDGAYRVSFTLLADGPTCVFPHQVLVAAFDGETRVWQSPSRLAGATVTIDGELFPDCPSGASIVRVLDDDGELVPGAQVYVDGRLAGTTGLAGHLQISPPLVLGQLLAARKMVHEVATSRDNHVVDGETSWAYRVYLTSVRVRADANGDGVQLPLVAVTVAGRPIDLVVSRRNALVALNLTVSIEWNASSLERERIHDRIIDASQQLYNATDGQFLIQEVWIAESGIGWDDADVRIYANLNQASDARTGGLFGSDGRVRLNPNDAFYAGTLLHELGHYALAVRDEYEGDDWDPANGPVRCTLQSSDVGTPFSEGGEKDSCFMRGAQFEPKKKLCSAHPDNPHVSGTEQGDQDCWSDALGSFGHASRWRLQTPASRGAILGRLPDSGIPPATTTPPPAGGDQVTPSFTPVRAWQPRTRGVFDNRGVLAEGVVVRTEFNGTRVRRQQVTVEVADSSWKIFQGATKGADGYDLAYGLSTGNGEIPLRGAHVGDTVSAVGAAPSDGILVGTATINQATPHTLVIAMTRLPSPFPFALGVAPHGGGALRITTGPAAEAAHMAVHIRAGGATTAVSALTRVRSDANGVALVGAVPGDCEIVVSLNAVTAEGEALTIERRVVSRIVDDELVTVNSPDARCRLRLRPGTFDRPCQVLIAEQGPEAPAEIPLGPVVAGPYDVLVEADATWNGDAALTFRLPTADLPRSGAEDWMASLQLVELESGQDTWRPVPSTYGTVPAFVTTRIDRSGTFALIVPG